MYTLEIGSKIIALLFCYHKCALIETYLRCIKTRYLSKPGRLLICYVIYEPDIHRLNRSMSPTQRILVQQQII